MKAENPLEEKSSSKGGPKTGMVLGGAKPAKTLPKGTSDLFGSSNPFDFGLPAEEEEESKGKPSTDGGLVLKEKDKDVVIANSEKVICSLDKDGDVK